MTQLLDYKNKHLGKDIYIYASGKSCDFIDNSFFKNKIVIGVNQSFKKIIPTYLVRKEFKLMSKIINNDSIKNIIHFISRGNCGSNNNTNKDFILKNYPTNNNIIIYNHNTNNNQLTSLPIEDDKLVVSASTITTAIHLAAYMGAKNIIIVGHDCGLLNGESNFKGYHTKESLGIVWRGKNAQQQYNGWLKNIESQTIKLKNLLEDKYRCNILSLNPFINFNLEGNKYTKG